MVGKAIIKYIRISPRKLNYVIEHLRNKSVLEAEKLLLGMKKRGKYIVYKALKSAVNSALQKNAPLEALYISKIAVDNGPIWHRYRAGTMGRAMPIRKRTSHLIVELDVKYPDVPVTKVEDSDIKRGE